MTVLSIAEFIYASFTDIRTMETEPLLILACILARTGELIWKEEHLSLFLVPAIVVFFVFLIGGFFFSVGGADALIGALICINIGFYGVVAILAGLLISVPAVLIRKGRETPLIPFLSIGYVLVLMTINHTL